MSTLSSVVSCLDGYDPDALRVDKAVRLPSRQDRDTVQQRLGRGHHREIGLVVERCLGEGSMGAVFKAFDRERDMPVALKTVRAVDAQGLYRLKTEFRARADLEHRNLVRLGELPRVEFMLPPRAVLRGAW